MNTLRYFPSFVTFNNEGEGYKAVGNTTLLYDNEREQWAVGMTGAGMDFTPELVATFVNLGQGVPLELATSLTRNYRASLDQSVHERICDLVGNALVEYAANLHARGCNLLA